MQHEIKGFGNGIEIRSSSNNNIIENNIRAIGQVTAFLKEVEALRDKKLTTQQANQLTTEAQRIIDLIKG